MLKINFLGDSITEGCGSTDPKEKGFVSLVGKNLPCIARNYGIGGTRIAINSEQSPVDVWDLYFGGRVKEMNRDADYVFVFGGTNDYGHGKIPFGEFGDTDPHTFYGAVDYLINELLKYYKLGKLVFILPLYRFNETSPYGDGSKKEPGKTLPEYREAMLKVLNKYQVRVLDVKEEFGKGEDNPLLLDGLHPNDEGHLFLSKLICDYIKKIESEKKN